MFKSRIISSVMIAVIGVSVLTGCGQTQDVESTENSEFDIDKVMANLDDGGYYIVHNNVPQKVYFGNATFEEGNSDNSVTPENTTERVMWYTDDFDKIPTMYDGDRLIYYSTDELTETFNFERFEDLGYTIGVAGLKETVSGRYKFETDDSSFLYPDHDTAELLNFPQDSVILDEIGGKQIRKTGVSRGGTIYGLPKDKTYKCKVYGGTELTNLNFKSDVHAFAAYQAKETNDYKFLSSTVIQIMIPEWFNTGYYCMDGLGMFRYVIGTKYDENTNFNVVNNDPTDSQNDGTEEEKKSDTFFIAKNELGAKTFTVKLGAPAADAEPITAKLTVTAPNGQTFTAEESDENKIILNYEATEVGEYRYSISDLGDRTYEVANENAAIE